MGFDQRQGGLQNQPVGTLAAYPLYSQMGVVLYDEQQFRTAGGSQDDPTNDNQNVAANGPEWNEELWLDANSLSLMVNRYNGTLVRGE
jgi:hypothetical protein